MAEGIRRTLYPQTCDCGAKFGGNKKGGAKILRYAVTSCQSINVGKNGRAVLRQVHKCAPVICMCSVCSKRIYPQIVYEEVKTKEEVSSKDDQQEPVPDPTAIRGTDPGSTDTPTSEGQSGSQDNKLPPQDNKKFSVKV